MNPRRTGVAPPVQDDLTRNHPDDTGGLLYSELASTLHADHVAVAHLLDRVMRTTDPSEIPTLWGELYTELSAHAEAEEETVYRDLVRDPTLQVRTEDAIDDHQEIDRLLLEIDDMDPAAPSFVARLARLDASVKRHVRDEEEKLLPLAEEVFELPELDRLLEAFNDRKRVALDHLRIERAKR